MIDDDTLATPTVTGLVFGNYVFGLKVSSPTGDKDYSELDVGAVATDGKGVVIQGNPDADRLFGPMIAFGKNPWQYADDTHLRGAKLRSQYYDTISPPEWKQYLPGKIDYTVTAHLPQTTTVGAIPPTGMTVPVSSTANLNLSSFPTIIAVGGIPGYGGEEVLICSASGSILTVCFDGRGWRNSNPRSWGTGTSVFQRRVVGTGTNFLTTFCPAGPGQEGPVQYSAGSITVSPASAVLTGAGTEWTSANGIYTYLTARIEGTHSGIPFVFFSPVSAINSPTQITLGRPWPSDADAGSVSYKLIQGGYNQFAPLWTRPDGSEGQTIQAVSACLNDTDLYLAAGAEAITGVNIQKNYALLRNYWISFGGNGTPNYYDEVLANYALYFRSGWKPALDAARKLGDYWLSQPLLDDGWYPGAPRNSSIAGVVAGTVLDGRTQNWPGLRRMASKGVTAIAESCAGDLREHSYGVMWLAFAAQFDPVDTGSSTTVNQRSYWKAKLAESYARDDGCRGADNSFPTPLIVSTTSVTVTNGSTAVTGTGFTAASCLDRTAGGTGTISVNGSTLTVESGVPGGAKILITGTQSGVAFNQYFQFSGTTLVLLSGRWPGDSGSVTWQSEASGEANSWIAGSTSSAPTPGKIYGCSYNSPTSLTLNRNWAEASGVGIFTTGAYALTGWGTQPFMLGIATLANKMAAQGASGATATNYAALANATAGWVRNTGFDAATGGLYYGRGFSNCEPVLGTSTTPFIFRNLGCNFGASADGKATARALLAEAQNAVRVVYEANPSASNREWGDTVYANLWGRTGLTDPAVPLAEGKIDNYFASDQSLKGGKWYGFQFGIGMAHQWPAVRLGGQQAAIIEDLVLDYNTNPYPAATAVVVKLQRPSGEIVTYNCGTESCAVQLDRRQGSHWYQLEYLNISGAVLARGEWQFLPLP